MILLLLVLFLLAAAEAGDASVPLANAHPDVLVVLAMHAAAIAGLIRGAVAALRSPSLAFVWEDVPLRFRPLLIVALGGVAAVFDHVALGEGWASAVFAAVGGVLGAVTSHEFGGRMHVDAKPRTGDPAG